MEPKEPDESFYRDKRDRIYIKKSIIEVGDRVKTFKTNRYLA